MEKFFVVLFAFLSLIPNLSFSEEIYSGESLSLYADSMGVFVLKSPSGHVIASPMTFFPRIRKMKKVKEEERIGAEHAFMDYMNTGKFDERSEALAESFRKQGYTVSDRINKIKEFWLELSAKAFQGLGQKLSLGKRISHGVYLEIGNDNFLGGGTRTFNPDSKFDGNDQGKTFSALLKYFMEHKDGEFSASFFTKLYTKWLNVVEVDSNGDRRRWQNALSQEGVKLSVLKDKGKYFLRFSFETGREKDSNGLSAHIQDTYHKFIGETFSNIPQYRNISKFKDSTYFEGRISQGQRFVVYKNGDINVKFSVEYGLSFHTDFERSALFVQAEADASYKKVGSSITLYLDSNKNYSVKGRLYYNIVDSDRFNLRFSKSIEVFEDEFTRSFFDTGKNRHHFLGIEGRIKI